MDLGPKIVSQFFTKTPVRTGQRGGSTLKAKQKNRILMALTILSGMWWLRYGGG